MEFSPLIKSRNRFPSSLDHFVTNLCAQVVRMKDLMTSKKQKALTKNLTLLGNMTETEQKQ